MKGIVRNIVVINVSFKGVKKGEVILVVIMVVFVGSCLIRGFEINL